MKFRMFIICALFALIFSACASPATQEALEESSELQDGSVNFGDLIGNFGDTVENESDDNDSTEATEDETASDAVECEDPNAELSGEVCVCKEGYFLKNGVCKKNIGIIDTGNLGIGSSIVDNLQLGNDNEEGNGGISASEISVGKLDIDVGPINTEVPIPYVQMLLVKITTGSKSHSGTDSKISFAVRVGDEDEWSEFNKNSTDTQWTHFDKKNENDFEKNDVDTYIHWMNEPVPLNDITGFTLHHDGTKDKSGWLLEGIEIRAYIIDKDGHYADRDGNALPAGEQIYPAFLYYNPWVMKWIDEQEIDFSLNDVAVAAWVGTDSEHHDEDGIGSGTDNDVFLDINLSGPRSPYWGDFHPFKMGPNLDDTSSGLELLLDWKGDKDHNKGYDKVYADFVSLENIKQLNVDSINLRLDDEKDRDDIWRPRSLNAYIFKPAKVLNKKRGERVCWYIDAKIEENTTIDSGDEGEVAFPQATDCTHELISYHNGTRPSDLDELFAD